MFMRLHVFIVFFYYTKSFKENIEIKIKELKRNICDFLTY